MSEDWRKRQAELNIGTTGHVDHGKTTLTWALSGIWAARHSEELRRGITLRLGYADTIVLKCPNCPPPQCYTTYALSGDTCKHCGSKLQFLRKYSFVDCPGHEIARPLWACNVRCLWQQCLLEPHYLMALYS